MKIRIGLLAPLALSCACAFAQESSSYATNDANTHTTTYSTANGPLVVNWGQPGPHDYGPAPAFGQLDHGSGFVSSEDASAYPPLANDFIHADRNRDGRISKAEYDRWSSVSR